MSRFPVLTLVFSLAASLLFSPLCSPCAAQDTSGSESSAAVEEIEEIEEIEVIEEVDAVEVEPEPAGLFQTLGRFHPVVLHFPIAWLLLLVLVEIVALTGRAGDISRWTLPLLVLTLLSFIPAIVSGLGLASTHGSAADEFIERMLLHRNLNISAGVVLLSALAVRMLTSQAAGSKARLVYFLLVLAAAGLMGFGSHLGGVMVWGEGFLPLPF